MENLDYERLEQMIKLSGKTKTALCRSLGRPNYYLRDLKKREKSVSSQELEILASELDCNKDYLTGLSCRPRNLKEQAPVSREIDEIYDGLSDKGQEMLCDYGKFLISKPELRAPERKPKIRYLRHYLTAAAAGYAAPIEGEDFELIEMDAGTPQKADFCIDISGDSMEPYIHDGERVYVERDSSLSDLDVGIFFVDGDVYCKQFCRDYNGNVHLLSANPRREDANISFDRYSGRSLICFGRVILPKKLPMPIYE